MSTTEINLESVDWNNLSVEAFQELHAKLDVPQRDRKPRSQNNQKASVKINGKYYTIPYKTFVRLNNLKSLKSKEKLQEEIMSKYSPIEEI